MKPKIIFQDKIEWLDIKDIQPHPKNPRLDLKEYKERFESLKASILEGVFEPLKISKLSGFCLGGHQRLKAFAELGYNEIPVIYIDCKDEKEEIEILFKDNNEWGFMDYKKAIDILQGIDVNKLGFSQEDINKMNGIIKRAKDNDDEVPELTTTPKSKKGDIYQLGKHRLMCGDSTSVEDVDLLMNGHKADMIFTDPLYNVNYKGTGENTSRGIMNDKMSNDNFIEFLDKAFKNYRRIIKDGGGSYVFHSTSTQSQFEKAMVDNGFVIKNQLIWNKPNFSLSFLSDYKWKHEPFYYAYTDKARATFYGMNNNNTIIDLHDTEEKIIAWVKQLKKAEKEGKTTIWTMKRDKTGEYIHPTQKPVELITYALNNSSKQDDIVVDLFAGSGSVIIACEKLNRVAYSMELDPTFIDLIIERWENYTEQKAIKIN